jgi:hypothetical protein
MLMVILGFVVKRDSGICDLVGQCCLAGVELKVEVEEVFGVSVG